MLTYMLYENLDRKYTADFLAGKIANPHVAWFYRGGEKRYIARTLTWEGPARPDYAAATADLRDRIASVK